MNPYTKLHAAKTTSWPGATPFFQIPSGAVGVAPAHDVEPCLCSFGFCRV